MAKKIIFCILFLSAFNSFAKHKDITKQPLTPAAPVTQTKIIKLSKFTAVDVEGSIDIDLHDGYKDPKIIVKSNSLDLPYLETYVHNQTLFIKLGKGYPHYGSVKIEVRTKQLNSFKFHGIGSITGTKLHTGLLALDINNQGNTKLGGYIGLKNLILDGKGSVDIKGIESRGMNITLKGETRAHLQGMGAINSMYLYNKSFLEMYWINARDLHVWLRDNAYLKLAGIATHLYADLCQQSYFNGRYLRAQSSFVKTHDKARADISSTIKQHTLAQNSSDIFYYELPNMQANFMSQNGSVLDLRDINNPFFEEPTRYNKDPLTS